MIPTGIEPVSTVPETAILSIELRDQILLNLQNKRFNFNSRRKKDFILKQTVNPFFK